MGAAANWVKTYSQKIEDLKKAHEAQDSHLIEEILNQVAPCPTGDNVREPDGLLNNLFGRVLEVVDPKTDKLDNPKGPAVIEGDGTRKWYRYGLLHNAEGPAVLEPDGSLSFYYFGQECDTAQGLDEMVEAAEEHEERSTDWQDIERQRKEK